MQPPERFATARLVMRRPLAADARAIFDEYGQDPDVTRYLSWRPNRSLEETAAFVEACNNGWAQAKSFHYCLVVNGAAVGMISLRPNDHRVQFGYVLTRRLWGQGLAAEALSCLADWALGQPEVHRAQALCEATNTASARVMEKAGFALEGVLRRWLVFPNLGPEPRDCRMYARVRG